MMNHGSKDPKKVRAGRLGGKKSGGNFKRNKKGASLAGRKSAYKRAGITMDGFSTGYEPIADDPMLRRGK